jgi:hypothetical protein
LSTFKKIALTSALHCKDHKCMKKPPQSLRFFWYSAIITLPQTWRIVPLRYFYNYWYFLIWCHENPHQPRGSYPLEVSWYLIFLLYGGRIFPNLKGRIIFTKDLRGAGDILPIWFHDSSPPNLKGRILPIWLSR